jgi:hypothetical protein
MNQKPPPDQPGRDAPAPPDERRSRLAAALRENLKRRKAQGRARKAEPAKSGQTSTDGGN